MRTEQIKAAGYVRVSTSGQMAEGKQSLDVQRESIRQFAAQNNYKLTEIYSDEGISGGTVKNRHALQQCLFDGQDGKFSLLIVHRLSRFGRNAGELIDNQKQLKQVGIELRSISEGIDFSTKYGKFVLGVLALVAELERDIITETMLEGRIAKGRKGIPTSGNLPFARKFNKETGQWQLDQDCVKEIERAAREYLAGGSLFDIAGTTTMSYSNLIKTLTEKCGDQWTVNFAGEKPITYTIPRILSDETIQRVKDRLEFNRTNNRRDLPQKYVLAGFIRCEHCTNTLRGQMQTVKGVEYRYYTHAGGRHEKCKNFSSIPLEKIEYAVFSTIFENIVDVPSFEQAISESLPDEKMINDLELEIKSCEKELKRVTHELDKLVGMALAGTLNRETIKSKELELIQVKADLTERLETARFKLRSMPDVNKIRKEAGEIRRELLQKFSGKARLAKMTFDEKRELLFWLFSGKDGQGTPYGIYINKTGKRNDQTIDYFLYGKIVGLRTMKNNDIDYYEKNSAVTNCTAFNLY